jgi:hypothetical protein
VHYPAGVAEGETAAALVEVGLNEHVGEHSRAGLHVLLEVAVKELKDEVKLGGGEGGMSRWRCIEVNNERGTLTFPSD